MPEPNNKENNNGHQQWLQSVLQQLEASVPKERFHGGKTDQIINEGRLGTRPGGHDTICAALIERFIDSENLHSTISKVFDWYAQDCYREDRINALARLLAEEVIAPHIRDVHSIDFDVTQKLAISCEEHNSALVVEKFEDMDLPVSFIPFSVAVRATDGPPKFGTIGEEVIGSRGDCDMPYTKVFISHRWAAKGEPDLGTDWADLLFVISQFIASSLEACFWLVKSNFPLARAITSLTESSSDLDEFPFDLDLRVHSSTIALQLGWDIITISAKAILKGWSSNDCFQHTLERCGGLVAQQILLWYDWCCLPQPPRETQEDEDCFRHTLDILPALQDSIVNTLCLMSDRTYYHRAWCVSEWANAGSECSHWNRLVRDVDDDETQHMEKCQCLAFELLLDPGQTSRQVLERLGLEFTVDAHIKYEDIMCWILWNSMLRSLKPFGLKYFWDYTRKQDPFLIGRGSFNIVMKWLKQIRAAFQSNQRTGYNRQAWQQTRDAAQQEGTKVHKEPYFRIIVGVDSLFGFDTILQAKPLQAAISEAIEELEGHRGDNLSFEVYIEPKWNSIFKE